MKIILITICALFLSFSVFADNTITRKVIGTDGCIMVTINVIDMNDGDCCITISNDTDKNINVSFDAYCGIHYAYKNRKIIPCSKLVKANSEVTMYISFNRKIQSKNEINVENLKIPKFD